MFFDVLYNLVNKLLLECTKYNLPATADNTLLFVDMELKDMVVI